MQLVMTFLFTFLFLVLVVHILSNSRRFSRLKKWLDEKEFKAIQKQRSRAKFPIGTPVQYIAPFGMKLRLGKVSRVYAIKEMME